MKYKDGYIIDYDMLDQMSVDELEDTLIRISQDRYLSEDAQRELIDSYLSTRHWKLSKAFVYTEENVRRMSEVNELFKKQTAEVMRLASQIWQDETAIRKECPDGYNSLEVDAQLVVPSLDVDYENFVDLQSEKEMMVWNILSSPRLNKNLHFLQLLSSDNTFAGTENDTERKIIGVLYGFDQNGEVDTYTWITAREPEDQEKVKDICFVWPFHTLYDHCHFAMQDILKIKQFNLNIKLEYENL